MHKECYPPRVNHPHKVLREKDGEIFSVEKENQNSIVSIEFPILKPYLFLKNIQSCFDQEELL